MACTTTWLQSSSFHVYRCGPTLFRRCIYRRSDFRRFYSLTSNGGSFLFRHSGTPVYAQAKRGFSTNEVASVNYARGIRFTHEQGLTHYCFATLINR